MEFPKKKIGIGSCFNQKIIKVLVFGKNDELWAFDWLNTMKLVY